MGAYCLRVCVWALLTQGGRYVRTYVALAEVTHQCISQVVQHTYVRTYTVVYEVLYTSMSTLMHVCTHNRL